MSIVILRAALFRIVAAAVVLAAVLTAPAVTGQPPGRSSVARQHVTLVVPPG